ncbi:MAG: asparagine synthetase B family protein [Dehalococcoidia bacterium]
MAGLVGVFDSDASNDEDLKNLVRAMSHDISYADWDIFNQWDSPKLSVARVHHGVINPEKQPIFNEDNSICIFMDGEVFDYEQNKRQLIRDGHQFKYENNDAEYILHLYESRGLKAFSELNGSFAIILYHPDSDKILLVSDRMLTRPLYYFSNYEQLVFGSQLRPVLKFPGLPRRLDMQAVYEFFYFRCVSREKTYYQDIKSLPPAGVLQFSQGKLMVERYWKPLYKGESRSDSYYVEALSEAFKKAVSRRTQGNHRYGILLSGGIDSRTVFNADIKNKIKVAFTQAESENREVRIARRVAAGKGCRHVFLKRDLDHYFRNADMAIDIGDGMYEFWGSQNLGFMAHVQSETDIILDGYGFGAPLKDLHMPQKYAVWFGQQIPLPTLDIPDVISGIFRQNYMTHVAQAIFRSPQKQILDSLVATIEPYIKSTPDGEALTAADRINYLFLCYSARQNVDFLWTLHLRQYLEPRLVIYDNDILDLTYAIPATQKINGRLIKKVLARLSFSQALIPYSNTGLPAFITDWPESILLIAQAALRKFVFKPHHLGSSYFTDGPWPNYNELYRFNTNLKDYIGTTIKDAKCLPPEIFDLESIKDIYNRHMSGQGEFATALTALTTFGRWYSKYGPG